MSSRTAAFGLATLMFLASAAHAQPVRTFSSSTGNDMNVCSLTAPCRSLQAAFNAVATAGEVILLDSAGYGVLTINRSVSVTVPTGIYGGVTTSPGGTGITVVTMNAADSVVLRGLTINGLGAATYGIDFQGSGSVYVESCAISNFVHYGVVVRPALSVDRASIKDTTIRDCQAGGIRTNYGQISIDGCRIEKSGIGVECPGGKLAIRNTLFDGNGDGIYLAPGPAGSIAELENCIIEHSSNAALFAEGIGGGSATINVSNTMIVLNTKGVIATSLASINSFGNNKVSNNTTPGGFTGSIAQQ